MYRSKACMLDLLACFLLLSRPTYMSANLGFTYITRFFYL